LDRHKVKSIIYQTFAEYKEMGVSSCSFFYYDKNMVKEMCRIFLAVELEDNPCVVFLVLVYCTVRDLFVKGHLKSVFFETVSLATQLPG